ncbi:bcl-2-like protein 11 isoform X3 [Etheostoma spectabile]|uniref:bcl-2-like protein 11 isoform X3 n=1 Tax=Etheostoma spectabile TaxID=54343 RepID=UPI0013AF2D02|nr:bcl-2-like protein 11 isoform X3 [Etheostoma spectabile]
MHDPSRPPNRSDGSAPVTTTQGRGGDPPPVGGAGASAQTSRSNDCGERICHTDFTGGREPDSPSWCRTKAISPDSLGVFRKRSIFHLPRRASSGYYSSEGDSLPSSPLSLSPVTADRATQTPSPTGQVMSHALQRMAGAQDGGPTTHQLHAGHAHHVKDNLRAPLARGNETQQGTCRRRQSDESSDALETTSIDCSFSGGWQADIDGL